MPSPARKVAGWTAVCVACVSGFEGLRTVAYRDPVGIPTICFGETKNVSIGDTATADQCAGLLSERLSEFNMGVDSCVRVPLTDARRASFVSFSYNVGTNAFCRSTLVRKLNAGDTAGACDELLKWNKAAGIPLPGLTKRRQAERELCREGL